MCSTSLAYGKNHDAQTLTGSPQGLWLDAFQHGEQQKAPGRGVGNISEPQSFYLQDDESWKLGKIMHIKRLLQILVHNTEIDIHDAAAHYNFLNFC